MRHDRAGRLRRSLRLRLDLQVQLERWHCLRGFETDLGANRALDDVSLSVGAGEIVGLVGENGAGKTTLMRVAFGSIRPDEGRLFLRGREVGLRSPAQAIADWTVDQRGHSQRQHRDAEHELHGASRHTERGLHGRQCGQQDLDRDRPQDRDPEGPVTHTLRAARLHHGNHASPLTNENGEA